MKQETFYELGVRPEDAKLFKVERAFYLVTKVGPSTVIPKGSLVYLGKRNAEELFSFGKVSPLSIGKTFKALWPLRFVSKEGEWVDVKAGDIIKLDWEEALPLLREKKIKEWEDENDAT